MGRQTEERNATIAAAAETAVAAANGANGTNGNHGNNVNGGNPGQGQGVTPTSGHVGAVPDHHPSSETPSVLLLVAVRSLAPARGRRHRPSSPFSSPVHPAIGRAGAVSDQIRRGAARSASDAAAALLSAQLRAARHRWLAVHAPTQLFLLPPLLFVGARPAATAARSSAARRPPWPPSIWPVAAVAAAAPARPPVPPSPVLAYPLLRLASHHCAPPSWPPLPSPARHHHPVLRLALSPALLLPAPLWPPPCCLLLRASAPPLFLAVALAGSVLHCPAKQPLALLFRRRRSCFSLIPCPPSQPPLALLSQRRRGCFGFFLRCP
ncbi:uncharacterized protein LOC130139652 [Syzygium oleosum]|uniref:uncharacterized protein LOC130139652 n=1 Tax=Syzygium oleosum TaxID=219896 RepID=UPI0024B9609E|nr:uncharacterized protein LOC130139652 [Syzygium oleosum]